MEDITVEANRRVLHDASLVGVAKRRRRVRVLHADAPDDHAVAHEHGVTLILTKAPSPVFPFPRELPACAGECTELRDDVPCLRGSHLLQPDDPWVPSHDLCRDVVRIESTRKPPARASQIAAARARPMSLHVPGHDPHATCELKGRGGCGLQVCERRLGGQNMPPSTPMRWPVMYEPRSDTRNRTASATSRGVHT